VNSSQSARGADGKLPNRETLWLPLFIPLFIGPPAALASALLEVVWLGPVVAVTGTFLVIQDALMSRVSCRWLHVRAAGLAVLFCAIWILVVCGAITTFVALVAPEGWD
jgi:hypothetical protein